jgi:hypothetical protein
VKLDDKFTEEVLNVLRDYILKFDVTECSYPELLRADLLPDIHVTRMLHGVLGVATELEEFDDATEYLRACDDNDADAQRIEAIAELGDLLWFSCLLLKSAGLGVESLRSDMEFCVNGARQTVLLLDRLKAVIFYRAQELKAKTVTETRKLPVVPVLRNDVATLVSILLSYILGNRWVAGPDSPGSEEAWLKRVCAVNLAKLSTRHQSKPAITAERDYEAETQTIRVL